jgi:hypothetical protein
MVKKGVLLLQVLVTKSVGKRVAPNNVIVNHSSWYAFFIICSFAYIILGWLLALIRLVFVIISSIVLLARLDL